jgi:hypothetical protein
MVCGLQQIQNQNVLQLATSFKIGMLCSSQIQKNPAKKKKKVCSWLTDSEPEWSPVGHQAVDPQAEWSAASSRFTTRM